MATRNSTPKYEVYHTDGCVILSGVSKTEATQIARAMNRGSKRKNIAVRPVKVAA
jgi:hypothetical protein